MRNCKTIGQLKLMLWRNESCLNLSLRWVLDGYPILHPIPIPDIYPQRHHISRHHGMVMWVFWRKFNCVMMGPNSETDEYVFQSSPLYGAKANAISCTLRNGRSLPLITMAKSHTPIRRSSSKPCKGHVNTVVCGPYSRRAYQSRNCKTSYHRGIGHASRLY